MATADSIKTPGPDKAADRNTAKPRTGAKAYIILVADRNPRIRNFVQRELEIEGHRVLTAENADQLQALVNRSDRLDALVIDPDMPGLNNDEQLESMLSLQPTMTVIQHCLASDRMLIRNPRIKAVFVEKSGHSVDELKLRIQRFYAVSESIPDTGYRSAPK